MNASGVNASGVNASEVLVYRELLGSFTTFAPSLSKLEKWTKIKIVIYQKIYWSQRNAYSNKNQI